MNLCLLKSAALAVLVTLAAPAPALAESGEADFGGEAEQASRPPIGLEGIELEELESGYDPQPRRFIIPPYYEERGKRVTFRTLFPLYFQRERVGKGARSDLGVMPFYWRYREGEASADVYFPLYWRFRRPSLDTDIVLQTYYSRGENRYDFGFGPLVFFGEDRDQKSEYQVVPPLFWRFVDGDEMFTLAGLYYHDRDGRDYDLGLPPLFFSGRERDEAYTLVLPPLFWHFRDDLAYETTSVLPPFFFRTREHGWSAGLLPLLYFAHDRDWGRALIAPLYYYSRWGEGRSHYLFPLLSYYRRSPTLSQGGVAAFYHWYREKGDHLQMYTPLLWRWGNERTDDDSWMVPPLFYRHDSPVADDTMVGLVYWNFHEHHRERTFSLMPLFAHHWKLYEDNYRTWIAPTFDFGKKPGGYHFWLHPLFYVGKQKRSRHLVLAPLLWHFADEADRDTVVFPFWWNFRDLEHDALNRVIFPLWWQFDDRKRLKLRHVFFPLWWDFRREQKGERTWVAPPLVWHDRDEDNEMTGVLNAVWNEGEVKDESFWTFRLFPFFACGDPPVPEEEGAYWSVLEGLVGWRRQGRTRELKLFWIPFDLSED
ncbi:MAG: hypothetical protein R6V85_02260 [Polyangia bacterium]